VRDYRSHLQAVLKRKPATAIQMESHPQLQKASVPRDLDVTFPRLSAYLTGDRFSKQLTKVHAFLACRVKQLIIRVDRGL